MADRLRAAALLVLGVLSGLAGSLVLAGALSSVDALPVRALTVLSGSMAPAIETGSVVVVRTVRPDTLRVGDVVTFRDPSDPSRLITHRLRGLELRGGRVHAVTRGDANTGAERWSVPVSGSVGLVRLHVPHLGRALALAQSVPGRLLLLVLPALALCVVELRRIWRVERRRIAVAHARREVAVPVAAPAPVPAAAPAPVVAPVAVPAPALAGVAAPAPVPAPVAAEPAVLPGLVLAPYAERARPRAEWPVATLEAAEAIRQTCAA